MCDELVYELLFHQNDKTDIPVSPPSLQEFFRGVERGTQRLHDLLVNILIRRTCRDILKWYDYDAETHERIDPERFDEYRNDKKRAYVFVGDRHQFFPRRELETIEYSIDETYQGLYQDIRHHLGSAGGTRHSLTCAITTDCAIECTPTRNPMTRGSFPRWYAASRWSKIISNKSKCKHCRGDFQ